MDARFPKQCPNCQTVYTKETWAKLKYVGEQEDGEGEVLELRNCPCTSTISIDISAERSAEAKQLK
jgi:hypothetical protein